MTGPKKSPLNSERVCTTGANRCVAIVWEFGSGKNLEFFKNGLSFLAFNTRIKRRFLHFASHSQHLV